MELEPEWSLFQLALDNKEQEYKSHQIFLESTRRGCSRHQRLYTQHHRQVRKLAR